MVRQHLLDRRAHAQSRAQDRNDQVLGVDPNGRRALGHWRVDRGLGHRGLAKGLVGDEPRDLTGEAQEVGVGGRHVAQATNLVGDDRMVDDLK